MESLSARVGHFLTLAGQGELQGDPSSWDGIEELMRDLDEAWSAWRVWGLRHSLSSAAWYPPTPSNEPIILSPLAGLE